MYNGNAFNFYKTYLHNKARHSLQQQTEMIVLRRSRLCTYTMLNKIRISERLQTNTDNTQAPGHPRGAGTRVAIPYFAKFPLWGWGVGWWGVRGWGREVINFHTGVKYLCEQRHFVPNLAASTGARGLMPGAGCIAVRNSPADVSRPIHGARCGRHWRPSRGARRIWCLCGVGEV